MKWARTGSLVALAMLPLGGAAAAQRPPGDAGEMGLQSVAGLELRNVRAEPRSYHGRAALRLLEPEGAPPSGASLAIVTDHEFIGGTIEVDLAGAPLPGAAEGARGFIGIAFHVQSDGSRFKMFYLRPTNGRAEDQLRRNHSVQYVAEPDYPWDRLRKEEPGVYESYADIQPGEWTRVRIVVTAHQAKLYLNGAQQPCLIVNDLKLDDRRGRIALWIGPGTDGYFSRLRWGP